MTYFTVKPKNFSDLGGLLNIMQKIKKNVYYLVVITKLSGG